MESVTTLTLVKINPYISLLSYFVWNKLSSGPPLVKCVCQDFAGDQRVPLNSLRVGMSLTFLRGPCTEKWWWDPQKPAVCGWDYSSRSWNLPMGSSAFSSCASWGRLHCLTELRALLTHTWKLPNAAGLWTCPFFIWPSHFMAEGDSRAQICIKLITNKNIQFSLFYRLSFDSEILGRQLVSVYYILCPMRSKSGNQWMNLIFGGGKLCFVACRNLVLQSGIELRPRHWELKINH